MVFEKVDLLDNIDLQEQFGLLDEFDSQELKEKCWKKDIQTTWVLRSLARQTRKLRQTIRQD